MTLVGWLAALVLFLQLPIPLYWFVLHPLTNFWRHRQKAAFITALACSWLPVTICLFIFHRQLFSAVWPAAWRIVVAVALIVFEAWLFWRLKRDLGALRLVGQTELTGGGEVVHRGVYACIRHPRYAGSFLAIIGACLLAGTRVTWMVAAIWCVLTGVAIFLEEGELRQRFGASYEQYRRRVPRFFPRLTKPTSAVGDGHAE
ncbi:MAG: methyltransferase family protein [Candidatus Acidiferrales bacterium]